MMELADLAIVTDANAVLDELAPRLRRSPTEAGRCLTSTSSWSAPARPGRPPH